jgi:hypothetical protein
VWEAAHGPSAPLDLHGGAGEAVRQAARAVPQLVGRFGYLEWHLPAWIPIVWLAALAALIVTTLMDSPRKRTLTGVLVATALLPPAFWLLALRPTGFALQGRHLLPILVALPLLAAELLPRTPRRLALAAGAAVGVVQFAAFAYDARRAATGTDGPLLFLGKAEWSPPGGWVIWLTLAALGALAAGLATARSARAEPAGSTLGGLLTKP